MSLHPSDDSLRFLPKRCKLPWSSLPKGNVYLRMRDELGVMYQDADFAEFFSSRGQPAESALACDDGVHHAVCRRFG